MRRISLSLVGFLFAFGMLGWLTACQTSDPASPTTAAPAGSDSSPANSPTDTGPAPADSSAPGSSSETGTGPLLTFESPCDNPPEPDFFNTAAAAAASTVSEGYSVGTIGLDGANHLQADLLGETICDFDPTPEAAAIFVDVAQLSADGKKDQAAARLADVLQLTYARGSGGGVLAYPPMATREETMRKVRDLLEAEAYDQFIGNDTGEYLSQAQDTYEAWATPALASADTKEALDIAGAASLLGLEELSQEAIDRAREELEKEIEDAVKKFDLCTASWEEMGEMLTLIAKGMLLGVNRDDSGLAQEIIETATARKDGKPISGCGLSVEWEHAHGGGMTVTGTAVSCDGETWSGTINVSGAPAGAPINSTGTFEIKASPGTAVEGVIETSGSANFEGEVMSFTDPLALRWLVTEDRQTVEITLGSSGGGLITLPGVGARQFASVFPGEQVTAPASPHPCE